MVCKILSPPFSRGSTDITITKSSGTANAWAIGETDISCVIIYFLLKCSMTMSTDREYKSIIAANQCRLSPYDYKILKGTKTNIQVYVHF